MIDTHAHLDACADPPGEVLARAREAGVTRVITVGSGVASCREALAICDDEDGVYAALGIPPHQAWDAREQDLEELRDLLTHPKAVAVGETGLDFFRDYGPEAWQSAIFGMQSKIAEEMEKPLVVHTRAADELTAHLLSELPDSVHVVLHCFSSVRLLDPALEHRWYVSFAGNLTYPKATDLRWAATQVPGDRLLVETDSPYLAPQPVRGRANEPAHVVHTLAALADARGENVAELERRIDENATAAFALS